MNIYVTIAIFLALFAFKVIYDYWDTKQSAIKKLNAKWAKLSEEEISYERKQTIPSYFESVQDKRVDIDDITFHDLDMETLFYDMNQTGSAIGEEYLYSLLRKPVISKEEYEERIKLIHIFEEDELARTEAGISFIKMGKLRKISVFEYLNMLDLFTNRGIILDYISLITVIASFALIPVLKLESLIFIVLAGIFSMYVYYTRKAKIGVYYDILMYLLRVFHGMDRLIKNNIPSLNDYTATMKDDLKEFQKFRRFSFLVVSSIDGGSIVDIIFDYIRMFFHLDLIKFHQMVHVVQNKKDVLCSIYEKLGLLDAMHAAASYRGYLKKNGYCEPTFVDDKKAGIIAEGLYHPFLTEPVKQTFQEEKSVLLTGSNASGKSTFLKAVALNAILAQTIGTAVADLYQAPKYKIFSSMALSDNLFENESYFVVEIKSLKRIMDTLEEEIPTLCFIDEVLRGTNTLERISASAEILKTITNGNVMCFAATHDGELTYILEKYYSNYHFTEQIVKNQIHFEYLLHKGRATSKNAISLLSMFHYDKKVVEDARKLAEGYLENGTWPVL